jgi:hypothetical protein
LTLHPSKGDGDTVQLPNRIVEGGVLRFEGMFGIGQAMPFSSICRHTQ